MATTCVIIQKTDEGYKVSSIRSDGYLVGVGAKLFKHYRDPEKISRLMAMGWVSPLEAEIEDMYEGETFDGEYPMLFPTLEAVMKDHQPEEYTYLWQDGQWHTVTGEKRFTVKPITRERLIREDEGWGVYKGLPGGIAGWLDSTERETPLKEWFGSGV